MEKQVCKYILPRTSQVTEDGLGTAAWSGNVLFG